jgi:hypothetical protein
VQELKRFKTSRVSLLVGPGRIQVQKRRVSWSQRNSISSANTSSSVNASSVAKLVKEDILSNCNLL